jgi:membrane carboxypeptidase/penicillin-binding protein
MTSYQMIHIMEGVIERGTAQKLKVLQRPIAGKTGTTNNEKDAWFIGFTPDLVVGVYMGFDDPAPLGHGETGGNVSAPVVRDFFKLALVDQPAVPFRAPAGIKLVRVNLKTGQPAGANDSTAIMEAFKPNEGPLADTSGDDQETGAVGNDSQSAGDATQSPANGAMNPAPQPATASSLTSTTAPPAENSSGEVAAKPALKPTPKSAKPAQSPRDQEAPNLLERLFKGSGGLY